MKKLIYSLLLIWLPLWVAAQVPSTLTQFNAGLNIFASNLGGTSDAQLTAFFNDPAGRYTDADMLVGDVIFTANCDVWEIMQINSTGGNINVDVRDVNGTGLAPALGQAGIMRLTTNQNYPLFTAENATGISATLQACIETHLSLMLDLDATQGPGTISNYSFEITGAGDTIITLNNNNGDTLIFSNTSAFIDSSVVRGDSVFLYQNGNEYYSGTQVNAESGTYLSGPATVRLSGSGANFSPLLESTHIGADNQRLMLGDTIGTGLGATHKYISIEPDDAGPFGPRIRLRVEHQTGTNALLDYRWSSILIDSTNVGLVSTQNDAGAGLLSQGSVQVNNTGVVAINSTVADSLRFNGQSNIDMYGDSMRISVGDDHYVALEDSFTVISAKFNFQILDSMFYAGAMKNGMVLMVTDSATGRVGFREVIATGASIATDTAYNGLTALNDSTHILGGDLTQNTLVNTTADHYLELGYNESDVDNKVIINDSTGVNIQSLRLENGATDVVGSNVSIGRSGVVINVSQDNSIIDANGNVAIGPESIDLQANSGTNVNNVTIDDKGGVRVLAGNTNKTSQLIAHEDSLVLSSSFGETMHFKTSRINGNAIGRPTIGSIAVLQDSVTGRWEWAEPDSLSNVGDLINLANANLSQTDNDRTYSILQSLEFTDGDGLGLYMGMNQVTGLDIAYLGRSTPSLINLEGFYTFDNSGTGALISVNAGIDNGTDRGFIQFRPGDEVEIFSGPASSLFIDNANMEFRSLSDIRFNSFGSGTILSGTGNVGATTHIFAHDAEGDLHSVPLADVTTTVVDGHLLEVVGDSVFFDGVQEQNTDITGPYQWDFDNTGNVRVFNTGQFNIRPTFDPVSNGSGAIRMAPISNIAASAVPSITVGPSLTATANTDLIGFSVGRLTYNDGGFSIDRFPFEVTSSVGTKLFRVRELDAAGTQHAVIFGSDQSNSFRIQPMLGDAANSAGRQVLVSTGSNPNSTGSYHWRFNTGADNRTSGSDVDYIDFNIGTFNPSSGSINANGLNFTGTIGQTGGANGNYTLSRYLLTATGAAGTVRLVELGLESGTMSNLTGTNYGLTVAEKEWLNGIGTNTPTAQLEIEGDGVTAQLQLDNAVVNNSLTDIAVMDASGYIYRNTSLGAAIAPGADALISASTAPALPTTAFNSTQTIEDADDGAITTVVIPAGASDGDRITFVVAAGDFAGGDGVTITVDPAENLNGVAGGSFTAFTAVYQTITLEYDTEATTDTWIVVSNNF